MQQLEHEVLAALRAEGVDASAATLKRLADLRYTGQAFELTIALDGIDVAAIEAAFHAEHARTYGHNSPGDPVDLINIRVVASTQPPGKEGLASQLKQAQSGAPPLANRQVFFGGALIDTPVLSRAALTESRQGPFIVEEFDATCIVPPGASGVLDAHGNIVIDAGAA